ncbi:MAG TPA: hypothetical protein VFF04_01620, partial [Candidatus Babeliales bacterium]|nr:hypothetical protein [Candidatus Babeliales bacterium]
AEETFPQATFMLMPDAEWCLCNAAQLVEFCKQRRDDTYHTGYQMRIINNKTLDYVAPRLIRCRTNTRFKGAVHEYLAITCEDKVPHDIYFDWVVTRYGGKKSQARWLRDKDILLRSYQEDPEDSRTVFYLGQTYACLGDWQSAYDWYLMRTKMAGAYEENFVTFVRLGDVTDQLGKSTESENPEAMNRWQEALSYYLKAFAIMPHRIEPLIKIANHYIETHEYSLAYLFARRALEIPYPHRDCLFIEKEMYDYDRYDIIGRVAWYIGEYEMGEQALHKALEKYPDMPHLHRNLAFYLERKKELEKRVGGNI